MYTQIYLASVCAYIYSDIICGERERERSLILFTEGLQVGGCYMASSGFIMGRFVLGIP